MNTAAPQTSATIDRQNLRRFVFTAIATSHGDISTEALVPRVSVMADKVLGGNYYVHGDYVRRACLWLEKRGLVRSRIGRTRRSVKELTWTAVHGEGRSIKWT